MKKIYSGQAKNFKTGGNNNKVSHNVDVTHHRDLATDIRHTNPVVLWNTIAIDATGWDHTPTITPGDGRTKAGEQPGPCRASRVIAMAQLAVAEAVAAITGKFPSYFTLPNITPSKITIRAVTQTTNLYAAVGMASYTVLNAIYTGQTLRLKALLNTFTSSLALLNDQDAVNRGYALGAECGNAILQLRQNDNSAIAEPTWAPFDSTKKANFFPNYTVDGPNFYATSTGGVTQDPKVPGEWSQDPITKLPTALGAYWNKVTPFLMTQASQYRAPAFPSPSDNGFIAAYNEAKTRGGDGVITPTIRTEEETDIGLFWAYDGEVALCAPPRLYNYITLHIAEIKGTINNPVEMARLLAQVNVAMADNAIACWDSKYYYRVWRPVTAIRNINLTGVQGLKQDDTFTPFGAPATNNPKGPKGVTPNFPSYPSGHGSFGGALFQTLREYYGTDDIPFTFVSEEFNGVTLGQDGQPRPWKPRSFANLSQAEEENGQSRIYLGIHWSQDKTNAIDMGRKVGVLTSNTLYPIPN